MLAALALGEFVAFKFYIGSEGVYNCILGDFGYPIVFIVVRFVGALSFDDSIYIFVKIIIIYN